MTRRERHRLEELKTQARAQECAKPAQEHAEALMNILAGADGRQEGALMLIGHDHAGRAGVAIVCNEEELCASLYALIEMYQARQDTSRAALKINREETH